jgi:hypothetical protein
MAIFSAAAAAALERSDDGLQPGVYSYPIELEFTVKTNGHFAPAIIAKVLAKLVLDGPDVFFVARDGNRILIDNFPQSKAEFDDTFCASTSSGKLSCKFEIRSSRNSIHAIKIDAWDILKKSQVWLKKSPGPVRKTPLTAIGFLMNVHPGFACSRVFHSQILDDIDTAYDKQPDLISDNKLPTTRPPVELYLCRRKITADYSLNDVLQPISSDALMVYVPTAEIELALIYLTKLSTLSSPSLTRSPMFIPLKAKYLTPGKFGQYVARHNSFLHDHRNIAIVGVVPEAMDDTDNVTGDNLWNLISSLPGVHRCDPCRRTPDLGKWNISCEKESHQRIADWIDENLVKFWSGLPGKTTFPIISTFPKPERLSKGRRVSLGSSVASGLTNASPVEDYFRQLESSLPPPRTYRAILTVASGRITYRSEIFRIRSTRQTSPNSRTLLRPRKAIPLRFLRRQPPDRSHTELPPSARSRREWFPIP